MFFVKVSLVDKNEKLCGTKDQEEFLFKGFKSKVRILF